MQAVPWQKMEVGVVDRDNGNAEEAWDSGKYGRLPA
jgi:hypothetical protein